MTSKPVLIGQRGDDYLETGEGNDLAIGDGGSNTIATNLGFPRVYQVYRSMRNLGDYAPGATDFGFVFMNDFALFPSPHRIVDSQASIIDLLLTVDDASSESHVVRDIMGISGSIPTKGDYCMHPVFSVIPGYVSQTAMLHGGDTIISNSGADFLIGDDLRGFSAFDLTDFPAIDEAREELDALVNDLSVRLSTLGYDAIHYADQDNANEHFDTKEYQILVGCDTITTNQGSNAFLTGDSLTFLGRTYLGSFFQDAAKQVS